MALSWLVNGGDPNYLLTVMAVQVVVIINRSIPNLKCFKAVGQILWGHFPDPSKLTTSYIVVTSRTNQKSGKPNIWPNYNISPT